MNLKPSRRVALKVAILGGGSHSAVGRAHISAIRLLGNVSIEAGCFSKDPQKNQISGESYGVNSERIHPNLETLIKIEQHNLSTVIVLTPTQRTS